MELGQTDPRAPGFPQACFYKSPNSSYEWVEPAALWKELGVTNIKFLLGKYQHFWAGY